jgi:hypothetical protein
MTAISRHFPISNYAPPADVAFTRTCTLGRGQGSHDRGIIPANAAGLGARRRVTGGFGLLQPLIEP